MIMDAPQRKDGSWWRSLSVVWMLVLTVCFAAEQVVVVHFEKPYDAYFALSGYGMKSGHLWELFTYQFFHTGWIQFAVNLAGLWFLGRTCEAQWGSRRLLVIYQGAVLAGAILQGLAALGGFWIPESLESVASVLRDRFAEMASGSSVGLCGLLAAYCGMNSNTPISPLAPLKGKYALWLALGLAVLFVLIPSTPKLPHLAHLGGLLAGLLLCRGRTSGKA